MGRFKAQLIVVICGMMVALSAKAAGTAPPAYKIISSPKGTDENRAVMTYAAITNPGRQRFVQVTVTQQMERKGPTPKPGKPGYALVQKRGLVPDAIMAEAMMTLVCTIEAAYPVVESKR